MKVLQPPPVVKASDGLPLLDHDMMRLYVQNEEKFALLRKLITVLVRSIKQKNLNAVKVILAANQKGRLFPWQRDEAWPDVNEQKILIRKHIYTPHYKLYRQEMVDRYRKRVADVVKLQTVFDRIIEYLKSGNKEKLWNLINTI